MKLDKDIYTVKEVAQLLDLTHYAITGAIRAGKLKADTFNHTYMIRRDDLIEYLEYRRGRRNGRQEKH